MALRKLLQGLPFRQLARRGWQMQPLTSCLHDCQAFKDGLEVLSGTPSRHLSASAADHYANAGMAPVYDALWKRNTLGMLGAPHLTNLRSFTSSRWASALQISFAESSPLTHMMKRMSLCRSTHATSQPSAAATGPFGQSMDAQEVLKFEGMAAEWWDPDGSSAALHTMNPLRTQFARDAICIVHG